MVPAIRAGSKPALFAGACALFFLAACAPTRRHDEAFSPPLDAPPAEARTIFLVHGDGDYSWHDSTGRRRLADQEAVKQAREAGASFPRGEVFLFHLRKGRSGWFREHDGSYEHYRGGLRVSRGTYSRTEKDTAFEAEAAILRRLGTAGPAGAAEAPASPPITRLAYFGHELPLNDQPGYFAGIPERPFSQARFARALGSLQPSNVGREASSGLAGKPYETIVLSMCYGGNPELVSALVPYARWLVASPAYLHLSYLDARALADPELIGRAADTVAARSFARLNRDVATEVTVATYDLEKARPPAPVPALRQAGKPAWKDCAQAPGFDSAAAASGVRLFYRPPRFGAGRDKAARSAWQCAF